MANRFIESDQHPGEVIFTPEYYEREYVFDKEYSYSQGARDRFESWGVDQSYGDALIQLGHLYSYAYPERKLAQILTGGLSIFNDENGVSQIRYHTHASTDPTLPFGACGELAKRKIIRGVSEGLFEDLNTQYGKLMPFTVRAYSPTHFNDGGSRHVWIGILPEDLFHSNYLHEMVIDDPSFRTITTFHEAQYGLNTSDEPPNINTQHPEIATYYRDSLIGKIKFNVLGGYKLSNLQKFLTVDDVDHHYNSLSVLGVTRDYIYSVDLSYVRDTNTGLLSPVVNLCDADGYRIHTGIQISPQTTIFNSSDGHDLSELPQDYIDQMGGILNLAYDAIAANNLS